MSALTGTIVLTGVTSDLGAKTVIAIAKNQPMVHLLLATPDTSSPLLKELITEIRSVGPRSVEYTPLDLTSFRSVKLFAEQTLDRFKARQIPSISAIVHCEEAASTSDDVATEDGFDPLYQVYCLSPLLLTISLLGGCRSHNAATPGTRIVILGSSGMLEGHPDFFSPEGAKQLFKTENARAKKKQSSMRTQSSKLLMCASMFALRRKLEQIGNVHVDIVAIGDAQSLKLSSSSPSFIAQLLARRRERTIKTTAKSIAKAINKCTPLDMKGKELYLKAEKEYEAESVIGITQDHESMQMIWGEVMEDAGFHRGSLAGSPKGHSSPGGSPNRKGVRFSAMVLRPILE